MNSTYQQVEREESLMNAQRVQQALLPKRRHFNRLFSNSFTFYEPQDLLSGDFYWIGTKHNLRYLVVGDCTGHGISASLTAVLAINIIEYVIMNKGLKKTTKILTELDKKFTESFKESSSNQFNNPWIDITIVCIDDNLKKLFISSANRKTLHFSNDKGTQIYKPSGSPIGASYFFSTKPFETMSIDFTSGDRLYVGSDGFQDQFGGPRDKKYGSKALHRLLEKNNQKSFEEQKECLSQEFAAWKGDNLQTDDVCIVGIEL